MTKEEKGKKRGFLSGCIAEVCVSVSCIYASYLEMLAILHLSLIFSLLALQLLSLCLDKCLHVSETVTTPHNRCHRFKPSVIV